MFSGIELSAHIACIYNEIFMNKNMKITRGNISELENEMKTHLTYFEKWRDHSISLKKDKYDEERKNIYITTNLQ